MPYIVDVPLRDGTFTVKAHSRPTHGQTKAISKALRARLKEEQIEELLVDNILTLCTGWDVTDEEGHPIPFTREGISSAPDDLVTELSDRLQRFVNRGMTFDQKLRSLADELGDDDPRKATLLGMVDAGKLTDPARKVAYLAGAGLGDLDPDDEDMDDAALLAAFDWSPSSLADLDATPERTLWLYVAYRNGQVAKAKSQGGRDA